MLTLTKCRQVLGNNDLADSQIETLLGHLTDLADVVLSRYDATVWQAAIHADDGSNDVEVEERAAIRECDGQLSRPDAEEAAVIDFVTRKERP